MALAREGRGCQQEGCRGEEIKSLSVVVCVPEVDKLSFLSESIF